MQEAFQRFLDSLVLYLETLLLYAEKHTGLFLKKLVVKLVWFVLVFFTSLIGFAYLSFSLFLSFRLYLHLDPILSGLLTSFVFLVFSILFLRFLLQK